MLFSVPRRLRPHTVKLILLNMARLLPALTVVLAATLAPRLAHAGGHGGGGSEADTIEPADSKVYQLTCTFGQASLCGALPPLSRLSLTPPLSLSPARARSCSPLSLRVLFSRASRVLARFT